MSIGRLGQGIFAAVIAAFFTSAAWAGIADTKHNLGINGTGANHSGTGGTAEICVFCHTPHGADTSANPPLWNRKLTGLGPFTTYNSLGTSTLDGEVLSVGSVSIACLSCHDGTQAMNVLINAPGSGGFDATNGVQVAGAWVGSTTLSDPLVITSIGGDLRNDHPVGVEYGGGGCNTVTAADGTCTGGAGGTTEDDDFKTATKTDGFWYVDVDSDTTREKTDMILYTRTFATGDGPSVECASCHDPHTSDNATFLRISNANSAVCLACHTK